MRVILKVRKKGIIILPKKLREAVGIDEGGEVIVDVVDDKLILKALKPKVVDVDPEVVEKILREEYGLEEERYVRMISSGKNSS